jgi:RNA polymerase primary sigma factor
MVDDDQYSMADAIEDTGMAAPVEEVSHQMLRNSLEQAMTVLNPRERTILEMRYGLQGGRTHTLDEVSAEFKLTRERIRQIEVKALRKLRYPERYAGLRDFVHA